MLQNRVDPFGEIVSTTARGNWTGTRGVIHNERREITRAFRHKAWITCLLEFKGRRRVMMTPNRYTELFFIDEATAFAAGHRPCGECRKADFNKFKFLWIQGNAEHGFNKKTSITEIDNILHQERIDKTEGKVMFDMESSKIPDGTFVFVDQMPMLIYKGQMFRWTFFGYGPGMPITLKNFSILTPKSIVNTFQAGYLPQINFANVIF